VEIKKGFAKEKAGDGIRTHDNNVGNVVLYQLSYTRDTNTWPMPFAKMHV
jgi:hypothetical protein